MQGSGGPSFGVGSLACYHNYEQVGEGTYGYVYKAYDKRNEEVVALKRLIFHKEGSGFPLSAVREIKFLKSLSHRNIVKLKDIVTSKGCEHLDVAVKTDSKSNGVDQTKSKDENSHNISQICGNLYLVFEYIEHDLGGLIDARCKFTPRSIKCIIKQLFEVLGFLDEKKIIHRDIKSSNILISNSHHVKLADFGLARSYVTSDGREGKIDLSNNVVTMWYKSPELLLGSVRYSTAVDVWSAGCVLAEMELGRPLFPGKAELEQLDLICRTMGTPSESTWPGLTSLQNYDSFLRNGGKYTTTFRANYDQKLSDPVLSLLERVLMMDPMKRSSAKNALSNKYFHSHPLPPTDPTELEPLAVTPGASLHEFQTKQQRKKKEEESKLAAVAAERDLMMATAAAAACTALDGTTVMSSTRGDFSNDSAGATLDSRYISTGAGNHLSQQQMMPPLHQLAHPSTVLPPQAMGAIPTFRAPPMHPAAAATHIQNRNGEGNGVNPNHWIAGGPSRSSGNSSSSSSSSSGGDGLSERPTGPMYFPPHQHRQHHAPPLPPVWGDGGGHANHFPHPTNPIAAPLMSSRHPPPAPPHHPPPQHPPLHYPPLHHPPPYFPPPHHPSSGESSVTGLHHQTRGEQPHLSNHAGQGFPHQQSYHPQYHRHPPSGLGGPFHGSQMGYRGPAVLAGEGGEGQYGHVRYVERDGGGGSGGGTWRGAGNGTGWDIGQSSDASYGGAVPDSVESERGNDSGRAYLSSLDGRPDSRDSRGVGGRDGGGHGNRGGRGSGDGSGGYGGRDGVGYGDHARDDRGMHAPFHPTEEAGNRTLGSKRAREYSE